MPAERSAPPAVLVVLILTCIGPAVQAQSPTDATGPGEPSTAWTLRNWTRIEWWRFFEPPATGGDATYAYPANRLQAAVHRNAPRYAFTAALQYVQFGNLPTGAVGPGPLGLGAVYFAHAERTDSRQVYLRYLNLQLKNLLPGVNVHLGRMPYSSGSEVASGNPKLEAIKQQRLAARLVGEFEWSLYQRGYDGVRVDATRPRWGATFVAFHPTQGGFEDAAGVTMNDIRVLGGSITATRNALGAAADVQAFALRYDDSRDITARPDNSGRAASAVDIGVNTFGATAIVASPVGTHGQWDALLWLAGQTGSWYGQSHRALSVALEAGHQWTHAPWRPWLRAGLLRASGDNDPSDDRHDTFFQMLPTVRRYAQTALYSQMNNVDLFVQVLARPAASFGIRGDVHRIDLASSNDSWYFGSGATQSRGTLFGFSTRPANGSTDLATIVEASADYTMSPQWSINAYLGIARGGEVVRRSFVRPTTTFVYFENVLQF